MAIPDGRYLSSVEFYNGLGGQLVVDSIEKNEDTLASALDDAELQADDYLKGRYVMPASLAESPKDLKSHVLVLVKYHIKSKPLNAVITAQEQSVYDSEISFLDKVRMARPDSPQISGLIEINRQIDVRVATAPLTSRRHPVLSNRLDDLRPLRDRIDDGTISDSWGSCGIYSHGWRPL